MSALDLLKLASARLLQSEGEKLSPEGRAALLANTGHAFYQMDEQTTAGPMFAKAAREQIRKDTAAVDKRMDDRLKRETVHGLPPTASTKKAKSDDKPRKKSGASKGKAKKAAKASGRSKQHSSGKRAAASR